MKIKTENYVCSICGKRNVKLWRPYMDTTPLICAECAEKRQTPYEYEETIWQKEDNGWYTGKFTGKNFPYLNGKSMRKVKFPHIKDLDLMANLDLWLTNLLLICQMFQLHIHLEVLLWYQLALMKTENFGDILPFLKKTANGWKNCRQDNVGNSKKRTSDLKRFGVCFSIILITSSRLIL